MTEIGNGGMAVLEIEALEKFRGIVRANPLNGIADGIGRAAVARECIRAFFRRHGGHRQHARSIRLGRLVGRRAVQGVGQGVAQQPMIAISLSIESYFSRHENSNQETSLRRSSAGLRAWRSGRRRPRLMRTRTYSTVTGRSTRRAHGTRDR